MMEWIKVGTEDPIEFNTVLLFYSEHTICTGYWVGWKDDFVPHNNLSFGKPTHWAELPEPPKQD